MGIIIYVYWYFIILSSFLTFENFWKKNQIEIQIQPF